MLLGKPRVTRAMLALALAVLCSPARATGQTTRPPALRPPNVVLVMADDAGYGDFSCYGQKRFRTPNIDSLAQQGLRFTQHYSGSTVCAPTRCSLMTGRHTGHCSVRGNSEHKPVGQEPMSRDEVSIASLLSGAGYVTGCFGKWGLGYPGSHSDPLHEGFDRFFGYNCQRNAHTYYPTWLYDDDRRIELDGQTYSHDLIMEQALAFIRAHSEQPFFCYLPVTIPHAAMHVPDEYSAPFREQWPQFDDRVGKYRPPNVKNPVAAFAGMMVKLDESMGQVLALLEELGLDENTVVLFTSDNGPHREGGHDPDFFDSNGPLSGYKRDLTEGGIRAPLLARWPGTIAAGGQSDLPCAHWDLLPTLCELAGVEAPAGLDGLSLLPTLQGRRDEQAQHEALYWEFHERGGKRAVRMGRWKAIQRNLNKEADPPVLLFDLETDLAETTDVAAQHPEVVARARELFEREHTPSERWRFKGRAP